MLKCKMFLQHKISILERFLKNHVTLKTRTLILKICALEHFNIKLMFQFVIMFHNITLYS